MNRNGTPLKRTRINPVSDRRKREGAQYRVQRLAFLKAHPTCQALLGNCATVSRDVHHMAGRLNGNYLNETTWLAVCRNCHDFIHGHPRTAKIMGLLK